MKFALVFVAALALPGSAFASLVTYTDRVAFETALGSVSVDNLDGVASKQHYQDIRNDYVLTSPLIFGCINNASCLGITGPNPGFDDAYLLHYNYSVESTFTFTTAVFGLGFDYTGNPTVDVNSHAHPILQGLTSGAEDGFFGVISDVALNAWTLGQTDSHMMFDNVTYDGGSVSSVPVPAALPLLLAALGGLGFAGRRRKSS